MSIAVKKNIIKLLITLVMMQWPNLAKVVRGKTKQLGHTLSYASIDKLPENSGL